MSRFLDAAFLAQLSISSCFLLLPCPISAANVGVGCWDLGSISAVMKLVLQHGWTWAYCWAEIWPRLCYADLIAFMGFKVHLFLGCKPSGMWSGTSASFLGLLLVRVMDQQGAEPCAPLLGCTCIITRMGL